MAAPDLGVMRRKGKQCNCKNSRCLKLYCECFASGQYCEPGSCNCVNCFNNRESEQLRAEAVEATLERNPAAFRPKIASGVHKGCNCKKSGCLKKYCECYQAGVICTESCKCVDCRNYDGSMELAVVLNATKGPGGAMLPKKRSKTERADMYESVFPPTPSRGNVLSSRRSGMPLQQGGGGMGYGYPDLPADDPLPTPGTIGRSGQLMSGLDPSGGGGVLANPYAPLPMSPSLVGDLRELKAFGRSGSLAPELAIIPDFGTVTQDAIRDECDKMMLYLDPSLESTGAQAAPYTAEFERSVLSTFLTTLRACAAKITSKHQV